MESKTLFIVAWKVSTYTHVLHSIYLETTCNIDFREKRKKEKEQRTKEQNANIKKKSEEKAKNKVGGYTEVRRG